MLVWEMREKTKTEKKQMSNNIRNLGVVVVFFFLYLIESYLLVFQKNSCLHNLSLIHKKITCILLNDFTTFIYIVPIVFFPFAGKEAISWLNQMIISITTINNNNNSSSSNNNSPENQDMWIVGLKLKLKWTLMPPSSATEDVKGIESNHLIWS